MIKNWGDTKQVLLKDVETGNHAVVTNAVYSFITIGNEEIIPDLVSIINNKGNKGMAMVYLNSDNDKLEKAAKNWAGKNGYKITSAPGSSRINWGSMH